MIRDFFDSSTDRDEQAPFNTHYPGASFARLSFRVSDSINTRGAGMFCDVRNPSSNSRRPAALLLIGTVDTSLSRSALATCNVCLLDAWLSRRNSFPSQFLVPNPSQRHCTLSSFLQDAHFYLAEHTAHLHPPQCPTRPPEMPTNAKQPPRTVIHPLRTVNLLPKRERATIYLKQRNMASWIGASIPLR